MNDIQSPLKFSQVVWSPIILLIIGVGLSFFVGNWTWQGFLGIFAVPAGLILGLGIYALGYFISTSPRLVSAAMHNLLQSLHYLFQNLSWAQMVILSILAGVGEELLIRGVLQSWLVATTTPLVGIIVASLIFGLLHYMARIYIIFTFAIGLLFGLAFHFSNSLV